MNRTSNTQFARTAVSAAVIAGLAGLTATASAQKFQRLDGTDQRETSYDLEQTRDGGSVTAGVLEYVNPFTGAVDEDFYVIKHDKNGDVMWTTRYGGRLRDRATSIHQTQDGGYIVAGHTESAGPDLGLALLRLDPTGAVLWAHAYEASAFEEVLNPLETEYYLQPAVRESREGGFVVVTNDRTTAGGQLPVYVRTDPAGVPLVNVRYIDPARGLATFAGFTDLKELDDASIAVSGFWADADPAPGGPPFILDVDILAMRAAPSGAPFWVSRYDEAGIFHAREAGYGIDIEKDAPFVIGAIAERTIETGYTTIGTDHVQLDPMTGAVAAAHFLDYTTPAYAATLYTPELTVLTSGIDLMSTGAPAGVGPGAAEMLLPGLAGTVWYNTYGPFSGAAERLEGNAIMDRTCGYAFTGPKAASAAGFGFGGTDQLLVKTDDTGESGCFERRLPPKEAFPEFEQIQMALAPDFRDNWQEWGERVEWQVASQRLCYDDRCRPCPADINGDGVLDNADISAFVVAFLNNDPIADFNADGLIDNGDIGAFVAAFLAGCP
ncbi:MAG: GC-type dockerin domain-anchored protein [Phycisphaerales bacterium JB040]